MPLTGLDLDAYFDRIGYDGPWEPTLEVLRDLHRLHAAAIPFENLTPLMGEEVSLNLADLEAKLVRGGRGGYCYEQNRLFWAALAVLGFQAEGLAARVLWGAPADAPVRPRSHMLLLIRLPEGEYIADVGFGGMTMSGPLAFEPGPAQATPHERFRLTAAPEGRYDLEAELAPGDGFGEWRALYCFDLAPHLPVDYEPMNWFAATHPASPFPKTLMAARAEPDRRLALSNTRFTVRKPGQPPEERTLQTRDELAEVLTQDFGLTLPPGFVRAAEKLGLQ